MPSMPTPSQSTSSCGGPTKRWARRSASAPSASRISSGATRLPFDLDILSPPRRIIPWVNSRVNGSRSSLGATPRSASALVKKRAYIRWRMACSTPPMYWSTGIQRLGRGLARRARSRSRARRSAGSTTTSRRTCPWCRSPAAPDRRTTGRWCAGSPRGAQGRLAGGQELDVVGRQHRQLVVGDGHDAAPVAVDDRDRAAPEALAADQPVAQAVVDLALADALLARGRRWPRRWPPSLPMPSSHSLLMCGPSPVKASPSQPSGGWMVRTMGRPWAWAKSQSRWSSAGHGHDGAGAVAHEHVVGEVERARAAGERVAAGRRR